MNQRTAKLIRKGVKRSNRKQLNEFTKFFSVKLNGLPLRKRIKFAWAVVRGRVD